MSLNTQNLQSIINFIWTVADDVLINKFLETQPKLLKFFKEVFLGEEISEEKYLVQNQILGVYILF